MSSSDSSSACWYLWGTEEEGPGRIQISICSVGCRLLHHQSKRPVAENRESVYIVLPHCAYV